MNPTANVHQLRFKTQFRAAAAAQNALLERDMARSKHMRNGENAHGPLALMDARHRGRHPNHLKPDGVQMVNVMNAGVTYLASVDVGSPATTYNLLIDTGSSNTWVSACDKPFNPTETTTDTRNSFNISYGKGECRGTEYLDQVSLGPGLVIRNQSIGVATEATDMNGMDGILGIGPTCLTCDTMASAGSEGIPTVMDNLLNQKVVSQECIAVSYAPTTGSNEMSGCLCIGGPDSSMYTGELNYVPITKQSPSCNYWGLEQSISYGGKEIMVNCAGISDTGTTLIMIPSSAFNTYMQMTGATMDDATGLLCVTDDQYENMQSLMFNINGVEYELTKNAQMWPRSQNSMLGGDEKKRYLVFANMGDLKTEDGLCFINGYALLQRFFSVYDTTNCRLGMATTQHTLAETN
ncbi:acid protease [Mycena amicta]|nr:acid protease [Mycena amicta]